MLAVCARSKKDPRFDLVRMALVSAFPSRRAVLMLVAIAMYFAGCTGLVESAIPSSHGSLPSSNSKENIAFLLATAKVCRYQEMLREFHTAAPRAEALPIRNFAHAIDDRCP